MAKFEHRRYPAIVFQDEGGVWAQFEPEERSFGEHTVRVGVLETDDEALADRLRACTDPDLSEVGGRPPKTPAPSGDGVPEGSIEAVWGWVGDDRARAQQALDAEKAGKNRATLVAGLEKLLAGE